MDRTNLILYPPDGDLELYWKQFERTKRNLEAYHEQFCKDSYNQNGYSWSSMDKLLDYVSELIAYERSDKRVWKNMVMEEVMENRRKRKM